MPADTHSAARRAAFQGLVDYAGLFPPAQLDIAAALQEYEEARAGPYAWMLGRFIVPASRLEDLRRIAGDRVPPLSVILDAGGDARTWLSNTQALLARLAELCAAGVRVEALEIALPPLRTKRESYDATIGQFAASLRQSPLADVPAFVELPRDERWENELSGAVYALARHRLGAKVRCGGVIAQAFPEPREIAAFLAATAEEQVPFKATAGLHHPVRHFNKASGFTMHGFLNVLAAAAFARAGRSRDELERVLDDEEAADFGIDGEALRWNGDVVDAGRLHELREGGFIAYGSCSFTEPVEDLRHLELL